MRAVMEEALRSAGIDTPYADAPVMVRVSQNEKGERILFFLNYSMEEKTVQVPASVNLITDEQYQNGLEEFYV